MKATLMTIALLCAGAAYAQTPPPAPPHGADVARHMDDLATLLDLTEAQKAQVQAILQQQHAKMKESFEQAKASGTKPDWEQMKAMHEQLQQETLQKLAPVLSATQLKKFQIIQQQMHAHMGHMAHGQNGTATPPAQN
jgi:Spy/CpxP family protein refolding chaperone